jgi:nitrate reductase assembly molybdenum cofactor insertion protein NarJ
LRGPRVLLTFTCGTMRKTRCAAKEWIADLKARIAAAIANVTKDLCRWDVHRAAGSRCEVFRITLAC